MSWAAHQIIELHARLRLACQALSRDAGHEIQPEDIRLGDLNRDTRERLLAAAELDFRADLERCPNADLAPVDPSADHPMQKSKHPPLRFTA